MVEKSENFSIPVEKEGWECIYEKEGEERGERGRGEKKVGKSRKV